MLGVLGALGALGALDVVGVVYVQRPRGSTHLVKRTSAVPRESHKEGAVVWIVFQQRSDVRLDRRPDFRVGRVGRGVTEPRRWVRDAELGLRSNATGETPHSDRLPVFFSDSPPSSECNDT